MATINRNIPVEFTVDPEELAKIFCNMDSDEQAEFFSAVAKEVKTWDKDICFQLQWVTDSDQLTPEGKAIMKAIGEYGE